MARLLNRCGFIATAGGTADFVVSAAALGLRTPTAAGAVDGKVYSYYAQSSDLTQYEWGFGTWTASSTTLARTTVLGSTNAGAKVNFTAAPTVKIDALAENIVTGGVQCGRFVYVGAQAAALNGLNNGDLIQIAGKLYRIPSGGVSAPSTSTLTNNTTYYAYLYDNAGTLTIEWSTTGHATDTTEGNVGIEIKSGDNTRSLIGMIRADGHVVGGPQISPMTVASWFNRQLKTTSSSVPNSNTTSTTPVTFASGVNSFVTWGDEVWIGIVTVASNSVSGDYGVFFVEDQNNTIYMQETCSQYQTPLGNPFAATLPFSVSEGFYSLALWGESQVGTNTFSMVNTTMYTAVRT